MKFLFLSFLILFFSTKVAISQNIEKAYFAGGCFWCMEESFDKVDGVIETISGYSGGHVKNPKYKDVVKNSTGHYETLEITYDSSITNFKNLLEIYWINIDPFDTDGQFCDRGRSYTPAIYYKNDDQKKIILSLAPKTSIVPVEKESKFYPVREEHQNYYKKQSYKYEYYRFMCRRDKRLEQLNN